MGLSQTDLGSSACVSEAVGSGHMTSDLVLPSDDDGPEDPTDDGDEESLVLPSEADGSDFEIPESLVLPSDDEGAALHLLLGGRQ